MVNTWCNQIFLDYSFIQNRNCLRRLYLIYTSWQNFKLTSAMSSPSSSINYMIPQNETVSEKLLPHRSRNEH